MAIVNYEHLLDQAELLITLPGSGAPRQADLRRAISTAYYALFHLLLTTAADEVYGAAARAETRYALAYRSIDHRGAKDLCDAVRKPTLSGKLLRYAPANGFGANLAAFCLTFSELQEKRHAADYDPLVRLRLGDVVKAVTSAREAVRRFKLVSPKRREVFVALLLFSPR